VNESGAAPSGNAMGKMALATLALTAGLVGCALETDPAASYAMLDFEARRAGYALEIDDLVVSSLLPARIDPGSRVDLVGPSGAESVRVPVGVLIEVSGEDAQRLAWPIGSVVRDDRLVVDGTRDGVLELADRLGCLRSERHDPGTLAEARFELVSPGLFEVAAEVDAPEGIAHVCPVAVDEETAGVAEGPRAEERTARDLT
jgi:hypothetical protein